MTDGFDPYRKWLGIRSTERPPHHYSLLGLEVFEDDADVICAAADRQMTHVRTYQSGPHAALSQKLLNELAAAKLCLLQKDKKKAYDVELQARLLVHPTPAMPASAMPVSIPQAVPLVQPLENRRGTGTPLVQASAATPSAKTTRQWQPPKHHITPAERLARQQERKLQRRSWKGWAISTLALSIFISLFALGVRLFAPDDVVTVDMPNFSHAHSSSSHERGVPETVGTDVPNLSATTLPAADPADEGGDGGPVPEENVATREAPVPDVDPVAESSVSDAMPVAPDVSPLIFPDVGSGTASSAANNGAANNGATNNGENADTFRDLLQAMADRDLITAKRHCEQIQSANASPILPLAMDRRTRLALALEQLERFWMTVEVALRQLSSARTFNYRDMEAQVVAFGTRSLTLQFADGQRREFSTERAEMDRDLAIALVQQHLADRQPIADQLIAVFLDVDREGDRELSKTYRERAAAAGRPVFLVHDEGPVAQGHSGRSSPEHVVSDETHASTDPGGPNPSSSGSDGNDNSSVTGEGQNAAATVNDLLSAPRPQRQALPPKHELDQHLAGVRKLLAEHYDYNPTDRAAAERLLQILWTSAKETKTEPLDRLVLAREAARVAAELGQWHLCQQSVALVEAEYDVDQAEEISPHLRVLTARNANGTSLFEITVGMLEMADHRVFQGDHEEAVRLVSILLASLRRDPDVKLIRFCNERKLELDELSRQHRAALKLLLEAGDEPATAELKAKVGEYFCFLRGDFARGLPLIAAGSESALRDLATRELKAKTSSPPGELAAVADAWWDHAETQKGAQQRFSHMHARDLYEQAMQGLRGLEEARVRAKLADFDERYQVRPSVPPTPVKDLLLGNRHSVTFASGARWVDVEFAPNGNWQAKSAASGRVYRGQWKEMDQVVVVDSPGRRDIYRKEGNSVKVYRHEPNGRMLQFGIVHLTR